MRPHECARDSALDPSSPVPVPTGPQTPHSSGPGRALAAPEKLFKRTGGNGQIPGACRDRTAGAARRGPQAGSRKSIRIGSEALEIFSQIRFYLLQFVNIFAAGVFIGFDNLVFNDFERLECGAVLSA